MCLSVFVGHHNRELTYLLTTFEVNVTACDLENSFIFDKLKLEMHGKA